MEKGNKTNSAFGNSSNLFYRQNGRIALRTFLENLRENGDSNADNKQITQCVFLGALCLKPVPDIFQVALQPYTFKTRTRSVFCSDAEGLNHRTDRPARKQPRKNTRKSINQHQKNANSSRILDLFDNTHISDTLSKLGLTSSTTSKQPDNKLALENAVPIEKHVRKTRKMDVKTKQLPLLVPVKEIIDLETKNGDTKKLEPILIELDEDEIEDYLEVDQNVVADLEALIPEEEIEFLSNSLIKPINENEPEEIKDIKRDDIQRIKQDDEAKVNQSLETIDCEIVEPQSSKSRRVNQSTPEIIAKNLNINIPDERKDYETRTLRSGVKVSPPYSQSVKSKRSQIPKLIQVEKKEESRENCNINRVQNEEIPIGNNNKQSILETIIVDDVPKNEETGEKLPIPTIVLDDNVKEEDVIEISVNKETEDKHEKNSSIFDKMMKNRRKTLTQNNKKQRKARSNPKTRVKAKKIEEIVDLSLDSVKNEDKVQEIINEDTVIIEDTIKKINGEEGKINDKVKEIINVDEEEEEEIIDVEKVEETDNVQANNNIEPNDLIAIKKTKNKRKTPKNGEIEDKTKKKKPLKKTKSNNEPETNSNAIQELPIELQQSELAKHLTNNNETTNEIKRINEEEHTKLKKKRKTEDEEDEEEEMGVSSPESSELSLENKDPDMAISKVEMESEDQLEYRNKEPYRRIYRCRVCLIVFETYNKLKAHKAVHDVQNPYQCQECGKSYDDVEELAAHLRIHKGKMPYPCKKCDSSFWTSVQLERHQMVHVLKKVPLPNNSAPKRIFKCEECGKEFKKICDLERHTRVHTGEKPSVCNICNKRFQQAYNLNKHLLIHTQEKNFECIICQKKFGRNDVLNRHVLTHSIDKPFHCSICSKTFIRNTQLNLHIRKHHGLKTDPKNDESGAGKSSD